MQYAASKTVLVSELPNGAYVYDYSSFLRKLFHHKEFHIIEILISLVLSFML